MSDAGKPIPLPRSGLTKKNEPNVNVTASPDDPSSSTTPAAPTPAVRKKTRPLNRGRGRSTPSGNGDENNNEETSQPKGVQKQTNKATNKGGASRRNSQNFGRSKTPNRPPPNTMGKKQTGFKFFYNQKILDFIKSSPEHLAKMEHEMKDLATLDVQKNGMYVKASSSDIIINWKAQCENRLTDFLKQYCTRTVRVTHYNGAQSRHRPVKVDVENANMYGYVIAITGLAKDAAKKVFEIKEQDRNDIKRAGGLYLTIEPQHLRRVTGELKQRVGEKSNVLITDHTSVSIVIQGQAEDIEKARSMIMDEIFKSTTKKLSYAEWMQKHLSMAISHMQNQMPEITIKPQGKQLIISGHPNEVDDVFYRLVQLTKDIHMEKVSVKKRYHKRLIGKNGITINELRTKHQVAIFIPPDQSKSETIQVEGRRQQVMAAKIEILEFVKSLREERPQFPVKVSSAQMRRITDDLKNKIFAETGVTMTKSASDEVLLQGHMNKLEEAKQILQDELLQTTENDIDVPSWLLRYMGDTIAKTRSKWSEVELTFGQDKITLSGHPTDLDLFASEIKNEIQNLEAIYCCESIDVHKALHKNIIGKGGKKIEELRQRYQVEVTVPSGNSASTKIKVEGKKDQVRDAINHIQNLAKTLGNNFKKDVTVPRWLMKYIIGRNGSEFKQIEQDHPQVRIDALGSKITLNGPLESVVKVEGILQAKVAELKQSMKYASESLLPNELVALVGLHGNGLQKMRHDFGVEMGYTSEPPLIYAEGRRDCVESALSYIKSEKEKLGDFCILDVNIDRSHFGKLIGAGGSNLEKLKSYSGVREIIVPRKDRPTDNVVITGVTQAVKMLCSHLERQFGATSLGYATNRLPYLRHWHGERPANRNRRQRPAQVHQRRQFGSMSNLSTASISPTPSDAGSAAAFEYDDFLSGLSQNSEPDRKLPVTYTWKNNVSCLLEFVKNSATHSQFLEEEFPADDESLEICFDDEIMINGEILESESSQAWEVRCKDKIEVFFQNYLFSKLEFPPESKITRIDEEGEDIHITWSADKSSVEICGLRSKVEKKTGELAAMKARKKKVSCRLECSDRYVMRFLKHSPLHLSKLMETMDKLGCASISDNEDVIVTGEILEILSSEKWAGDCEKELKNFTDQYSSGSLEFPSSSSVRKEDETQEEYVIMWENGGSVARVYGAKWAVNIKMESLLKKLEESQKSVPPAPITEDHITSDDPLLTGSGGKELSYSPAKIKCIMECLKSESKLAKVTVTKVMDSDSGIMVSGEWNEIRKAQAYLDSVVVEEVTFQKYGVHEFFMDNHLHVQYIGSKSGCDIMVEKMVSSSDDDDIFTCIPAEDDKGSKIYQNLSVSVEEGDITNEAVDMIVSTTDKSFSLSGPLSMAVIRKGGPSVRDQCLNGYHLNPGVMRLTVSGNLLCKHVLHVAIPDPNESMANLTAQILQKAEDYRSKTITIPTIGAGGGSWGSQDVATGIHNGILEFLKNNPKPKYLQKIKIILFPGMAQHEKSNFYSVIGDPATSAVDAADSSKSASTGGGFFTRIFSIFGSKSTQPTPAPSAAAASMSPSRQPSEDNLTDKSSEVESRKTTSGESAKVFFMSDNTSNVIKAKEEVSKFVELHLKDITLTGDVIAKLSKLQIDDIREIALNEKVRIVINQKDQCSIIMQGRMEFASKACDEVRKILESMAKGLPPTWAAMDNSQQLVLVPLRKTASEYLEVEKMFLSANHRSTHLSLSVQSIERVQNPGLYRHYVLEKERVSQRIKNTTIERRLFHGTSSDTVNDICKYGFNRSYSGKNATVYGKGVYFSSQSSYSNSYAHSGYGCAKQMFLANVITGDYCAGNEGMVEPPVNPHAAPEKYNSVVDSYYNPTIFVVFKDASVYPAYVIKYTAS